MFGRQLRQFYADLTNDQHMGPAAQPPSKTRAIMQVVLSLVLIAAALYVLLVGGFSETVEKFMTGLIGTILGYWLH